MMSGNESEDSFSPDDEEYDGTSHISDEDSSSSDENEDESTSQISDEENDDLDFNFAWTIQNFSLCSHKNGEVLESPVLNETHFDGKWMVELYPKGYKEEDDGFISLYLRKKNVDNYYKLNDVTFTVKFSVGNCFCLVNKSKRKTIRKNGERIGWRRFMEIKKFLEDTEKCEDDILKIQCTLRCKRLSTRSHTPAAYTEVGVDRNTFLWNVKIPDGSHVIRTLFAFSERLLLGISVRWDDCGDCKIRMSQEQDGPYVSNIMRCKLSLKGAKGNIFRSKTANHLFEKNGGNEVWEFPSFLNSFTAITNKSFSVEKNMLSWCFEFSVANGAVSSKIVGDSASNIDTRLALQEDFKNMFLNRIHSDVKLKANNEIVPAHKSVLSARSPVFFAMFNQDMKESQTGTVDISDVDAGVLKAFLEFIYTGKVKMKYYCVVKNLLLVANKYQVLSLVEKCVSFLKLVLSLLNACEMLIVADMINHHNLKRVTLDFIAFHSAVIFNTPEWLDLVKKHFKLASEVFSNIGANFCIVPSSSSACHTDNWYQKAKKRKRKNSSD